MNIGFDAKRLFYNRSGLGNYSRYIVRVLAEFFQENEYFLFKPKKKNPIPFDNIFSTIEPSKSENFLWRSKFIINNDIFKKLDVFHGLSNELPLGIGRSNVKSIVTFHDLIFLKFPELYKFIDRKIYFYKANKASIEANRIIAISEVTKNDILSSLNVDSSKIEVIYQSCSNLYKQIIDIEKRKAICSKYNLPKDYILNVGTVEPRKNALLIVKALVKVDIPLVIIGKQTDYVKDIVEYALKYKIENRIIFIRNVATEDLPAIYQNAKIFIYPSIYEGFGIPIIEAFNSNVPVIVSDIPIFREVAANSALFVNKENNEEMKDAIEKILNDTNFSDNLICLGKERALCFNDNVIANQLNNLYISIL